MRLLPTLLAFACAAATAAAQDFSGPVVAGWAALGDSFAAGIGAGESVGNSGGCRRRVGSHPVQLSTSEHLRNGNLYPRFDFFACSGAVIADVLPQDDSHQIDAFARRAYDLATVSIGGNDALFSEVLDACIFHSWRTNCGAAVARSRAAINGIVPYLVQTYQLLLGTADTVNRYPGFRVMVTGYPRFFNLENEACNTSSFGFWAYNPLTWEKRSTINELVVAMNDKIQEAVDQVNAVHNYDRVIFVNPDAAFEGHRFCEFGTNEPDNQTPNTWFFLLRGADAPTSAPLAGDPFMPAPADCDAMLDDGAAYPPLGEDWGRAMLCAIVKGVAEGRTLQPWLNNTAGGGGGGDFVWIPEDYAKAFHPKTRGHQAIKEQIELALQAIQDRLVPVFITYQGNAQSFDAWVATVPKMVTEDKTRKIQYPGIDIRGYATWLTRPAADALHTNPNVLTVSYESPEAFPLAQEAGGTESEGEGEGEGAGGETGGNAKRQVTTTDLNFQWPVVDFEEWHLASISRPPKFSGEQYLRYDGFLYDPQGGRDVTVYVLDLGVVSNHKEFPQFGSLRAGYAADGMSMTDTNGHGTCMASLVGGALIGASKRANIVPVKWFRGVNSKLPPKASALFEALLWILNDVQTKGIQRRAVVSFSAGIPVGQWAGEHTSTAAEYSATDPFHAMLPALWAQDVVVVCSVGNVGDPNDNAESILSNTPRRYARQGMVGAGRLIVVGATDQNDAIWRLSNKYHSIIATYAPGVDVPCANIDMGYKGESGTSVATAITSGIIATYLARQDLIPRIGGAGGWAAGVRQLLMDIADEAFDGVAGTVAVANTYNYIRCDALDALAPEAEDDFASFRVRVNGVVRRIPIEVPTCIGLRNPTPVGNYAYQGCVVDTPSGILTAASSTQGSLEDCAAFCDNGPFEAMGMAGDHCFCGVLPQAPEAAPPRECNTPCPDTPGDACGGTLRLSLYARTTFAGVQPVTGWAHDGCFTDSWERTLAGTSFGVDTALTPEKCAQQCSGWRYFGLENANECFCANSVDESKRTNRAACDMPCTGDSRYICGGGWLLSVYERTAAPPSARVAQIPGWRYSWCFTDSETRAITGATHTAADMTPAKCARLCCGWKYFGLENGNECFCGNAVTSEPTSPEECPMSCVGDGNLDCGGGWRLTVYESIPEDDLSACSTTRSIITTRSTTTTSASATTITTITTATTLSTATTTATSSTTSTAAPVTCDSSPPSCEASNCQGQVDNGIATCRAAARLGCACTPSSSTPGFSCGQPQSCDLNGCAGTYDAGSNTARCRGAFAGCVCTPTPATCGARQSCDADGCAGTYDGNSNTARCRGNYAGCECTPTQNTCGAAASCSMNGCAGTFDAWSNTARCRGNFAGCPCLPTLETCGARGACDQGGCDGAYDGNSNLARCTNNYRGCPCNPTPATCGNPQSCDANGCAGTYDAWTNTARCRGNFAGCVCNPTQASCGARGACDQGGCDGYYEFNSNVARCGNNYRGCYCNPTAATCGNPQNCDLNGCGGTIDNSVTRAATCKYAYRGCRCNPTASTPKSCPVLVSCAWEYCKGTVPAGQNLGRCTVPGNNYDCTCYNLGAPPPEPPAPPPPVPPPSPPATQTWTCWPICGVPAPPAWWTSCVCNCDDGNQRAAVLGDCPQGYMYSQP